MADIRCSRCGHFAFPTGISKEYKKWGGEIVCDSCYAELMREIDSLPDDERKVKEEAELAAMKAAKKEREERGEIVVESSNKKNTVATILQVYAIINAVVGLIVSFAVSDDYTPMVGVFFYAAVLGASFLIYSFGEVIKLLYEIKLNTRKAVNGK